MTGPKRLGREISDAELDRMLAGGRKAVTLAQFVAALDETYHQNTVVGWCQRGWLPKVQRMANLWVVYPEALREPRWRFPKAGRPWPQNDEREEQ